MLSLRINLYNVLNEEDLWLFIFFLTTTFVFFPILNFELNSSLDTSISPMVRLLIFQKVHYILDTNIINLKHFPYILLCGSWTPHGAPTLVQDSLFEQVRISTMYRRFDVFIGIPGAVVI